MKLKTIVINNIPEVLAMSQEAKQQALVKVGMAAEGYAKRLTPTDTGRLKNSITFATSTHFGRGPTGADAKDFTPHGRPDENSMYIGTNVEYAIYQELGTGKYAAEGNGRKTPWWYQDDKGEWHRTSGSKPHHFIGKSLSDHTEEYKRLIENTFKAFYG